VFTYLFLPVCRVLVCVLAEIGITDNFPLFMSLSSANVDVTVVSLTICSSIRVLPKRCRLFWSAGLLSKLN